MAKTASKTMPSTIVKRTVGVPLRRKDADLRTRGYLTADEVQRYAMPRPSVIDTRIAM